MKKVEELKAKLCDVMLKQEQLKGQFDQLTQMKNSLVSDIQKELAKEKPKKK